MRNTDTDTRTTRSRMWRKGERAKVSIFQVFRNSFRAGDAQNDPHQNASGASEPRSVAVREGLNETTLRQHLQTDLNALLNTVELGSVVDLDDLPHARASIINFGFRDLSNVSASDINTPRIKQMIRQSLINHEPRLVPGSIEVEVVKAEGDTRQRLSIAVHAELVGDPLDIPLDFDAEVDLSVGKLRMSQLRIQA